LAIERKVNSDGNPWTAPQLRALMKQLITDAMVLHPPEDGIQKAQKETLLLSEDRPVWLLLAQQLFLDTSSSIRTKILETINVEDITFIDADHMKVDLMTNISVISNAYSNAISGHTPGLDIFWAGECELTLLARHFKLRIATYSLQPSSKVWALIREYFPHNCNGPLHKLKFVNLNHFDYVI